MKYGNLNYLYLLPVIPLLIVGYIFVFRKKMKDLHTFANIELLQKVGLSLSQKKHWFRAALMTTGMLFLIFTLIEPKWGYHWEEVEKKGIDIVIAVDTSRSMLADDVKPNRLEVAKREIEDLLHVLGGDRIGLVAFAGSAFTYCPLTSDYGAFRLFLNDLNTHIIPRGGTALAEAIRKGLTTFERDSKNRKAIILITDGENHEDDPLKASEEAKRQGVVIYTVGVGKKEGSYIRIKNESGQETLLKDKQGQVVKSRLEEITLNKIALGTGGLYTPAYGTKWGLEKVYKESIAQIEESTYKTQRVKRYVNRYQIPLLIAIIVITVESFLMERRKVISPVTYNKV
ncbi:MAG: VWA domain-containing protein [Candidatus Jettenia sp.]|uniref:VWFA domain-containing protein n=1 Tax=Candidatus Jettenia caeni TaxID=247490 RepID=I3IL63_9BACT|nr:VWA domain-containing protein [Candidatus Jettenia sp. AMX1]MBC6930381.1 VWA domain-containing protein [Candidatus Jettenia sp.]WKZ14299.1 MAG: VWA domain-containing protein [Candidatus Jettenia caeni]KAA0247031.1 MAG: VWA domain-containing protein [Candidatus Jettenia sp. AMX1]MCE7881977.1 VWA domain-containing protein [Candidatus Jettenia sp. AMX1]MCQ3928562.1 VWA domain-containing protein [Candidatus Jettenia sp.]